MLHVRRISALEVGDHLEGCIVAPRVGDRLMPFSMVSSLDAPDVISRICSSKRSSSMSKSFCSVNVFGFMSNLTPVTSMSFSQWRRSASFLRLAMSGSDSTKPAIASSTFLYGRSDLSGLRHLLEARVEVSMPFSITDRSSSAQSVPRPVGALALNVGVERRRSAVELVELGLTSASSGYATIGRLKSLSARPSSSRVVRHLELRLVLVHHLEARLELDMARAVPRRRTRVHLHHLLLELGDLPCVTSVNCA